MIFKILIIWQASCCVNISLSCCNFPVSLTSQRSIAQNLFLCHLLLMRLVFLKSLALEPQSTIQENLIDDIIQLLFNISILQLGLSVMMLWSLDHQLRKPIILLHIFTLMEPYRKIVLYCFVRGLGYLSLSMTTLHITPVIPQFFKKYICPVRKLGCLSLSFSVTTLHITPV